MCEVVELKRNINELLDNGVYPGLKYDSVCTVLSDFFATHASNQPTDFASNRTTVSLLHALRSPLVKKYKLKSRRLRQITACNRLAGLQQAYDYASFGITPAELRTIRILERCTTPSAVLRATMAALFGYKQLMCVQTFTDDNNATHDVLGVGLLVELLRAEAEVNGLAAEASLGAVEMLDSTLFITADALRPVWLHTFIRGWNGFYCRPVYLFPVITREIICLNTCPSADTVLALSHWTAEHLVLHFSRVRTSDHAQVESPPGPPKHNFSSHIKLPAHYFSIQHMVVSTVLRTLFCEQREGAGGFLIDIPRVCTTYAASLHDTTAGLRNLFALLLLTNDYALHSHEFTLPRDDFRAMMLLLYLVIPTLSDTVNRGAHEALAQTRAFVAANPHMMSALKHGAHFAWTNELYGNCSIASPPNERLLSTDCIEYDVNRLQVNTPLEFLESVCNKSAFTKNQPPAVSSSSSSSSSSSRVATKRRLPSDDVDSDNDDSSDDTSYSASSTTEDDPDAVAHGDLHTNVFVTKSRRCEMLLSNTIAHCVHSEQCRDLLLSVRNTGSFRKARRLNTKPPNSVNDDDFPLRDGEEALSLNSSSINSGSTRKDKQTMSERKRGCAAVLLRFCVLLLTELAHAVLSAPESTRFTGVVKYAPALLCRVAVGLRSTGNLLPAIETNSTFGLSAATSKVHLAYQNRELLRIAAIQQKNATPDDDDNNDEGAAAAAAAATATNKHKDISTDLIKNLSIPCASATLYQPERFFSQNPASTQNLLDAMALFGLFSRCHKETFFAEVASHYFEADSADRVDQTTLFSTLQCFIPLVQSAKPASVCYYGEIIGKSVITADEAASSLPKELKSVQIERLLSLMHLADNIHRSGDAVPAPESKEYCDTADSLIHHPSFAGIYALQAMFN
jgi:hypothetical protein